MILKVLTFPNPILKTKAKKISVFDESLEILSKNMLETMYSQSGIGLAGNQVGELKQIVVIDTRPQRIEDDHEPVSSETHEETRLTALEQEIPQPLVLINPEIIARKDKTQYDEGCLSVPGFYETVERSQWIRVKAQKISGETWEFQTDGLLAICIQHELDHLAGKLFIDRLSYLKSSRIRDEIKEHGYPKREDILASREQVRKEQRRQAVDG